MVCTQFADVLQMTWLNFAVLNVELLVTCCFVLHFDFYNVTCIPCLWSTGMVITVAGFLGLCTLLLLWPGLVILHVAKIEELVWPDSLEWAVLFINGIVGVVISNLLWLWSVFYHRFHLYQLLIDYFLTICQCWDRYRAGSGSQAVIHGWITGSGPRHIIHDPWSIGLTTNNECVEQQTVLNAEYVTWYATGEHRKTGILTVQCVSLFLYASISIFCELTSIFYCELLGWWNCAGSWFIWHIQLECVAKPSLMAARPSKLSKRRSYTFCHYWTEVHVQRRFSINILLQWEDIRHRPI